MIDPQILRNEPERIRTMLRDRHVAVDLDEVLRLERETSSLQQEIEAQRHEQKQASRRAVGDAERKKLKKLKEEISKKEDAYTITRGKLDALLYKIPNIPFPEVPVGAAASDNKVLREHGKKPTIVSPQDYTVIARELNLIDTERAAKVSGSRFGYLMNAAARLEFAIVQFTFDRLSDQRWIAKIAKKIDPKLDTKAFVATVPPVMIRPEVFRAMGKLDPGQEDERYFLPKDNLYLVGSAEHSIGPIHSAETLDGDLLPRRYVAFSTCFRREAGSYGQDTKGILRVHQFDKIEMFSFTRPEMSRSEHKLFVAIQEALMQELKLPYRVVAVCTGDMVSTDAEQFDIETWLPGQNGGKGEYRETHSTSNSTDYQARRLGTRYKTTEAKGYVHTINGTAFAIGRIIIAILENYQTGSGVAIPKALQAYLPFKAITKQ